MEKTLPAAVLIVAAALCFAATARAGEPALPATNAAPTTQQPARVTTAETTSLLDTIHKGGFIGYIILGLSFVALSLIIEHAVTLRREKLCPEDLADELHDCFAGEQYDEALEICAVERTLLTDVVRAGLSRIDAGYQRMEAAMEEAGRSAAVALQQKISYLSLIAAVAPMLGLLGTVNGMVGAFARIARSGAVVKPSLLATHINEALVTTLLGLTVAIPVMCAYQFFANRVTRILVDADTVVADLMERFNPAT